MRATYIGILAKGTTSRMRAECLRDLATDVEWQWIDTSVPFLASHRIWRSLAFRAKLGPAVDTINQWVMDHLRATPASAMTWIDKGVFLNRQTIEVLRERSKCLVHYTPDPAFYCHRSKHFERSLPLFDLAVTTKSFEKANYLRFIDESKLHITTQGFDPRLHYPREDGIPRERAAVFIGLAEPERERCLERLLSAGVPVRIGGRGWKRFMHRHGSDTNLRFLGVEVFGESYAHAYSRAWVGLGLLSKQIPELHTTRTFEIPACGAILATERTPDTDSYFNDSEALFFRNHEELAIRVREIFSDVDDGRLKSMAHAGRVRVIAERRDYPGILSSVLTHPEFSFLSVRFRQD